MKTRIHVSDWLGKKKMTQKQLADATGIRPATISALYHETIKRIDIEHIDKLCEVFDCQPGDLFTYESSNVVESKKDNPASQY